MARHGAKRRLHARIRDAAAADEPVDQRTVQRRGIGHPRSRSGQELQQIRGQVVELGTAALAAQMIPDTPA